jgi:membrane fusion protein (multidrug efflux system)
MDREPSSISHRVSDAPRSASRFGRAALALEAIAIAALVPLASLGCSEASARTNPGVEVRPPIEVEIAPPIKRDIARKIALPVQLFPWQRTDVVAKVTGYVRTVLVDRGSHVKAGDVLATIWDPELAQQLTHQQAEQASAEKEFTALVAKRDLQKIISTRYSALIPDRAATQTQADVENANYTVTVAEAEKEKATVDALKEQVRITQTLLEYTTVRAPFDGVITDRFVHEGAFVELGKGTVLFHVVQSSVLRATIDIPEANGPGVAPGTPVAVHFAELGPDWIELRVARSAEELDPKTRTTRVEADLPNPNGRFQPGMYGQSTVTLEKRVNVLTVPSAAVLKEGGDSVLVVKNDVATRVPIDLGISDDSSVEAKNGLDSTVVVISPVRGIPEGARVKVRDKAQKSGPL